DRLPSHPLLRSGVKPRAGAEVSSGKVLDPCRRPAEVAGRRLPPSQKVSADMQAALAPLAVAAVLVTSSPARPGAKGPLTGGNHAVTEVRNVAYYDGDGADRVRHKLDLYLPKGRKDFPVLFFVHGGAWRSGSKDLYGPLGRLFARNGVGTVIIN